MDRIRPVALSIVLVLGIAFLTPARAAEADGVVTGIGRVTIKRQPQVMRVQFVVTGEAKDVAGAVAKLKEAQAAAAGKLKDLGAAEGSIESGPTRAGAGPSDARGQYAQYMQEVQRMMMPKGGVAPPAKPKVVIVSSTLKAEWALKAGTDNEVFVAGHALQEKVRATGIGKVDAKRLTPEELEAAEEAMGTTAGGGGGREPSFQYACKVSDADRAAARADAFRKAKQDAADTARAAGAELATLRQVSAVTASPTATEDGDEMFVQAMIQQMSRVGAASATAAEAPPDEATARAPTPVTLQVTVTASFAVK